MENKVKITVIMGIYNPSDEKKLFRAVKSIIGQSFGEWELVMYDDGSSKEKAEMIRRAAQMDDRILYLRGEENKGLAHALNEAVRYASGDYIARMDDDDFSKSERLEKQLGFLEKHPQYGWVGSNAELTDRHGVWGYQKMPEIPEKEDFLFNSPYIHPTVMFRKTVLVEARGYETSPGILQCEDYELFMRLHREGKRGYNLQEALLLYREDYASQRKRTYRRRIREMRVRYAGFKELGILNRMTFYYVVKPLLVGTIPAPVHHYIRRRTKKKRKIEDAKRYDRKTRYGSGHLSK